ncbi:MAG: hypothetical protein H6883_02645 [Rhodobiaceae bacterium]|nr:hypothetical protein [Rhodobiaceae bacterium]MCC0055017.1 hypothetical protein [Rhodobiaceae bacterium]
MGEEYKNKNIALSLLDDEASGNLTEALKKLHPKYSMTWMYVDKYGNKFPEHRGVEEEDFEPIYDIIGREYHIKNVISNSDVVMIEVVESYPSQQSDGSYSKFVTPEVIVLEFVRGKVRRGRHYCDPRVSHLHVPEKDIMQIFER